MIQIVKVKDYATLSKKAAMYIAAEIVQREKPVLGSLPAQPRWERIRYCEKCTRKESWTLLPFAPLIWMNTEGYLPRIVTAIVIL